MMKLEPCGEFPPGKQDRNWFYNRIRIDGQDRIYVLLARTAEMRVFNARGELLANWGPQNRRSGGSDSASLAVTPSGSVYILDRSTITTYTADGKHLQTITLTGEAAEGYKPPLAVDAQERFILISGPADAIHRVRPGGDSGEKITVRGKSPGKTKDPGDLCIGPDGAVFVIDGGNKRIQKLDDTGATVLVESFDKLPGIPEHLAVGPKGDLYCTARTALFKLSPSGEVIWQYSLKEHPEISLQTMFDLAISSTEQIYVTDAQSESVYIFSAEGTLLGHWPVCPEQGLVQQLRHPWGIAVDSCGNVIVTDTILCKVLKYSPEGKLLWVDGRPDLTRAHDGLALPTFVKVDPRDQIYISDSGNRRICKLSPDGTLVGTIDLAEVPSGLAIDAQGCLHVAEPTQCRIARFSQEGRLVARLSVSKQLTSINGIALLSSGHVFILDGRSKKLLVLNPKREIVATIPTNEASFPNDIYADEGGTVLISDAGSRGVIHYDLTKKLSESLNIFGEVFGMAVVNNDRIYLAMKRGIQSFSMKR